jgi:DNA modification methylase
MREKLHGYHPTQKPLRLVRRALLASSAKAT